MSTPAHKLAWLRLNAYGVLLAGLALMGVSDLINPGGANLARVVGEVPPGQSFWVTGLIVSGALLLWGFARADRLLETIGLFLLTASVTVQTAVAWGLLGWTNYTLTRVALLVIILACVAARTSALWSREGLVITIPARKCTNDE